MSETNESADILQNVKIQLAQIDELLVAQHSQQFESVHRKLEVALSTIDGL